MIAAAIALIFMSRATSHHLWCSRTSRERHSFFLVRPRQACCGASTRSEEASLRQSRWIAAGLAPPLGLSKHPSISDAYSRVIAATASFSLSTSRGLP